jgi:hypothetical protein
VGESDVCVQLYALGDGCSMWKILSDFYFLQSNNFSYS